MPDEDEEKEIDRLIDEAADEYLPFGELLKQNGTTFEEALSEAESLQCRFFDTLSSYGIKHSGIDHVCLEIADLFKRIQNDDTLFLYISILSENGLLFGGITDDEQKISLWLEHRRHTEYIRERIRAERILRRRFDALTAHTPDFSSAACSKDEQAFLYNISSEHRFIAKHISSVYFENLGELVRKVNSDALYSRIKPYIYSAVISRKHRYMLTRRHYSPNIRSVFKRTEYRIDRDNGKNFDTYEAYIELYMQLREHFADVSDTALSDHCFAGLSSLSDWFYENCEPTAELPMTLRRVIETFAAFLEFWHTGYDGSSGISVKNALTEAGELLL